VVEAGETCDPPSSCPQNVASCNDNDSCTTDSFSGSASNCTALCSHAAITQCIGTANDGCCPATCNPSNDRDCSATCANGVLEGGDQCDTGIASGPAKCPTPADCNDNNPCTTDSVQGTDCQAHCVHAPVTACSSMPDGCCPPGCNAVNDRDCSPVCGNGV